MSEMFVSVRSDSSNKYSTFMNLSGKLLKRGGLPNRRLRFKWKQFRWNQVSIQWLDLWIRKEQHSPFMFSWFIKCSSGGNYGHELGFNHDLVWTESDSIWWNKIDEDIERRRLDLNFSLDHINTGDSRNCFIWIFQSFYCFPVNFGGTSNTSSPVCSWTWLMLSFGQFWLSSPSTLYK